MEISRFITGVLLLALVACSGEKTSKQLSVAISFKQQLIGCNSEFKLSDNRWQLGQVQFFIANVELQNHQGQWQPMLLKVTANQSAQLALLGQNCVAGDNGNWQLVFADDLELSQYQKMRFQLGVPFDVNHLNPLTQPSPLNDSSMFWVWQTGHKFARIELQSEADNWVFHLGSTGCSSPSVMRPPSKPCRYPNYFSYELPLDNSAKLALDLSFLLNNITPNAQTSCQSEHDSLSCQQLLINLAKKGEVQVFRMANSE